jgi:very-short-patch-repair endonuclease
MRRFHYQSHRRSVLERRAREMRHAPTASEAALWALLRGKRLGVQFRRQVRVAGFIADFCAPASRLVVEVDGGSHAGRESADARRDWALARAGYRVLRLAAEVVLREPDAPQRPCGRRSSLQCEASPAPARCGSAWPPSGGSEEYFECEVPESSRYPHDSSRCPLRVATRRLPPAARSARCAREHGFGGKSTPRLRGGGWGQPQAGRSNTLTWVRRGP